LQPHIFNGFTLDLSQNTGGLVVIVNGTQPAGPCLSMNQGVHDPPGLNTGMGIIDADGIRNKLRPRPCDGLNGTVFGFQPDLKYYHGYAFLSPESPQDLKGRPAEPEGPIFVSPHPCPCPLDKENPCLLCGHHKKGNHFLLKTGFYHAALFPGFKACAIQDRFIIWIQIQPLLCNLMRSHILQ